MNVAIDSELGGLRAREPFDPEAGRCCSRACGTVTGVGGQRPVLHDLGPGDERAMHAAFDDARRTQPRGFPSELNSPTAGQWFVHRGWRFRWLFFPALGRWELAAGRRA